MRLFLLLYFRGSMIRNVMFLVILVLFIFKEVVGDSMIPRKHPFCGLVDNRIYCFGGETEYVVDSSLYYLDIAQFTGGEYVELLNKWEKVEPRTPFDPELRNHPNAAVLSDGKKIFLHGGLHFANKRFVNQTIIYDTIANSWEAAPAYVESDRGTRQMYLAAVVNFPSGAVGLYGGLEQLANVSVPQISTSGIHMPYSKDNRSVVGFSNIRVYTPEAKTWSSLSPQLDSPANFYPNSQIGILDPDSQKVYYIGGSFFTPTSSNEYKVYFGWVHTFNTKTGIWYNQTLSGEIPEGRDYHSANLMPNSPDIILYGGTKDYMTATTDYCFTLNLKTNVWTAQKELNIPAKVSGPRFTHSTVIVNTTMFVLFGRNWEGALTSSIATIDVANVSLIFYKASMSEENTGNKGNNGSSEVTTNKDKGSGEQSPTKGLDKGAIGGIVAGIAVGVFAIITAVLCCLRKKKKAENQKGHSSNEQVTEQLSVDWDKIDDQYQQASGNTGYSAVAYPLAVDSIDATKSGAVLPGNTTESQFQLISKDRTYHQVNQFESTSCNSLTRNIVKPSIRPGVVKPSADGNPSVVKPDAV